MKKHIYSAFCALAVIGLGSQAWGIDILNINAASVALGDPTQLGRLSRNGIPQDWSGSETPFPGVLNTATTYHYHAYSVNVGITPFVQISLDAGVNVFISAYDTTYSPNSAGGPNFGFDTNWLGDAGSSGNAFPGDPLFFQVVVPQNHNLLLIVNNTGAANVGVGDQYNLLVEGFIDTAFTDPSSSGVPEPATLGITGVGLAALAIRPIYRRRKAKRA